MNALTNDLLLPVKKGEMQGTLCFALSLSLQFNSWGFLVTGNSLLTPFLSIHDHWNGQIEFPTKLFYVSILHWRSLFHENGASKCFLFFLSSSLIVFFFNALVCFIWWKFKYVSSARERDVEQTYAKCTFNFHYEMENQNGSNRYDSAQPQTRPISRLTKLVTLN